MKTVFKGEMYFPMHVRLGAVLMLFVAAAITLKSLIVCSVVAMISLVVITAYYGVEIDLDNKTYREFVWLLGFKKGEFMKFNVLEYIFIKTNRESQTMNMRVASSTVTNDVFDAYLKISEEEKVHLLRMSNHDRLVQRIKPFAKSLNIKIIDYSTATEII